MSVSLTKESRIVAKHSLIYGLGNLLNQGLAFFLLPIYTRFLTPRDYGVKELVGLSADIIGTLLATAFSSAMYRFYFEYDDPEDRETVISTAIIAIGVIGVGGVVVLAPLSPLLAEYILDSRELFSFFLIAFCSMWFQVLLNVGYDYLRANHQSLRFVGLSFGKLLLAIALNIYFIIYLKIGVLGVLLSTLISSMALFGVLVIPLLVRVGFRFSWERFRDMLQFGAPVVIAQFGAFVVHLSGRFFIKGLGSIADTGVYSLGYRFGTLPSTFISGPFNQAFQPRRLELFKKEESERVFGRLFTYYILVIMCAGLFISVLSRNIIMIMADSKFWGSYRIVPFVVLANIVFSLHYHLTMGIFIAKKTRYLAFIDFSNGAFILVLNYFLISHYGMFGAAYASLAASIYKVSLTYYLSSRHYRIHFEFFRIFKILFVSALIYAISVFIKIESIYLDTLVKVLLIGTYPAILYLVRFFYPEELQKAAVYVKPRVRLLRNVLKISA
ncbi:MAG: Polysaccharide biosynthesis protein [Syntrophorhabdus sp. PtaU1.Bin002]|nr:MAG: Polysaccharide biosynthesis protein [Syntrophorhabdus sp. PtaU1.Bin002]